MTKQALQPGMSSLGAAIPKEIDPDRYRSVAHMLEEAIARYGERPAFVGSGKTLSFGEMDRRARAFAAYLQNELGVCKGDRVAVMLPNLLAFPVATLGIVRTGAVQVNVNPLYTVRELEHQLHDAGAKVIVVFNGSTPTLVEAIGKTGIERIVTVPCDGDASAGPAPDPRLQGAVAFDDALARGAELPFAPVELNGEDLLFLQYTGGTSGLSKGAVLSHRNLVANVLQFRALMGDELRPGAERVVTALPLYHIFALMVNFISYFSLGACNWLVANPRNQDSLIEAMKQARPTLFTGVNTLYASLVACPRIGEVDFSELHLAIGGGAAVIPSTSDAWKAITGTIIHEGYGLSETSPVLTFNPPSEQAFSGTAGVPIPSTDIRLIDDDGVAVAPGQRGEICAKGPQVMSGYWEKPEATEAAFTPDGYFRTGDIGQFNERGYLRIVDRKKDMIIVSGFNVYPNEIEAVAAACPGVLECACVGTPDEKTGERVVLFAVKAADAALSEVELMLHCRHQLAGYKVPKVVRFLPALPKSTVGKILRRELRIPAAEAI